MPDKKHKEFVLALRRLCREHDVQLAVSGYDALQVWDLRPGEDPICAPDIEDRTNARDS